MKTNQILLCLTLALTVSHVLTQGYTEANQMSNKITNEAGNVIVNGLDTGTPYSEFRDDDTLGGIDFSQMKVTRSFANFIGQTYGHIYGVKVEGSTINGKHPIGKAAVSTQMAAIYLKLWLTFNNAAVSKGPMWTNLQSNEDPWMSRCDPLKVNCDFKNSWNQFGDEDHHFFQGSVKQTQGQPKCNNKLFQVTQAIKLNKVFITLRARGRMIRGTRRDNEGQANRAKRNWPVLLTDENNDSEIHRFDNFGGGELATENIYGTANENAYVSKPGNYLLRANERWVESDVADSATTSYIGEYHGAECLCANKHKYKVGLLTLQGTDEPSDRMAMIKASRHSCVNGLILTGSVREAEETGEGSNFKGKSVECASSGWPVNQDKNYENCKNTDIAKEDACLLAKLDAYYQNQSSSRWHLDYKDWLIFKKFADKSHGAMSPCEFLLLHATRNIPNTCTAEFWAPHSADGYDDKSYRITEWYNKCLDVSFTPEADLCSLDN